MRGRHPLGNGGQAQAQAPAEADNGAQYRGLRLRRRQAVDEDFVYFQVIHWQTKPSYRSTRFRDNLRA